MAKGIKIGKSIIHTEQANVTGSQVVIDNELFYKIENSDTMRPFFMSIVSESNHWMFISSNGGLSAGRKNSEYALFPYYTDDKITESAEITGSKSILRVNKGSDTYLWEPFSDQYKSRRDSLPLPDLRQESRVAHRKTCCCCTLPESQ